MEILIGIWIVCAVVTASIGAAKGRSFIGWLLIGLLLGIFGLILIAALSASNVEYVEPKGFLSSSRKVKRVRCPECSELIISTAKVCAHCGYRLELTGRGRKRLA